MTRERALWLAVTLGLLGAVIAGRRGPAPVAAPVRPRAQPGVRLSMEALHQQGGVPLRWQLTLPPGDPAAGRQAFIDLGCHGCHRVAGESFSADASNRPGPDLSGMGSHHPPAYFAEAILNPDAVLIDAPGYVGEDGHSIMPTYPEMTTGQLSDLVAYLASLKDGGDQSCHGGSVTSAERRGDHVAGRSPEPASAAGERGACVLRANLRRAPRTASRVRGVVRDPRPAAVSGRGRSGQY